MTVYNLLIVDDEPYIVHCVADMLSEHEFENAALEIYTANNATEALHIFDRVRIDLLITDIEMPEISGLELVRRIHDRFPLCRTIILTAYPKYEYAIEALHLGIIGYILKTEGDNVILANIASAIRQLEKDLVRLPQKTSFANNSSEKDFRRLVQDPPTLPSREIIDAFSRSGFSCDAGDLVMIAVQADLLQSDSHKKYQARMLMNYYLSEKFGKCAMMEHNDTLYWLYQQTQAYDGFSIERWLSGTLETMLASYERITGSSLTITYRCGISSPLELPRIYAYLNSKLAVLHSACVFSMQSESKEVPLGHSLDEAPHELVRKLRIALENQNTNEFVRLLQSTKAFFTGNTLQNCPDQYAIYNAISGLLLEYGYSQRLQHSDNYARLMQPHLFPDWQDAYIFLREISTQLFFEAPQLSYISSHLLRRILNYVEEHQGENISLSDLSVETGYNTSYLSHFFKSTYGIPFSKYIAQRKISYIKLLMQNENLSLNDIAKQTGFESRSYFNRFVNRMTGLSPQEFRSS